MLLSSAVAGLALASPAAASQTVSPPSWNFGTLAIGQTSAPKSFTLTLTCRPNEEGTIPCQYPEYLNPVFTTTGDYSILSEDCPAMMVAGPPGLADQTTLSCTIVATFGPTGGGVRSGTLETGGPRATLTGFAPLPPAATAPVTKKKKCKRGHRASSAAKKRCKKRR